jgi:MFS family permease
MFEFSLYRLRAFAAGNLAAFAVSIARGGMQFVLIIWLQGIWLPRHGYSYSQTPLYAGIFLLPLTFGFLIAGPTSGFLSDRFGTRGIATAGMALFASSFVGLLLLPVNFPYWIFAMIIAANGIASGMFAAPNTASMMNAVPARFRGVASGMRATFQNSGTAISIGLFFSLMIAGLASRLPQTLTTGLEHQGVPSSVAHHIGSLPPVSSLFASLLGVNPIKHLLAPSGALSKLSAHAQQTVTGREFFPSLISSPFHDGLVIVFGASAGLAVFAGVASLLRGGRYVDPGEPALPADASDDASGSAAPDAALTMVRTQPLGPLHPTPSDTKGDPNAADHPGP